MTNAAAVSGVQEKMCFWICLLAIKKHDEIISSSTPTSKIRLVFQYMASKEISICILLGIWKYCEGGLLISLSIVPNHVELIDLVRSFAKSVPVSGWN